MKKISALQKGHFPMHSSSSVPSYPVHIHDRQRDTHYLIQVPADQYILASAEAQGIQLPFACRNGACTTCAVRVRRGSLYQPEAMGISRELKEQGYGLLCVGYARSELWVETQDEDEVYELQFGRYFGQGQVRPGIPIEDE
ncbi:ferredoxin [Thermostichus sp. MS-CIW-40]